MSAQKQSNNGFNMQIMPTHMENDDCMKTTILIVVQTKTKNMKVVRTQVSPRRKRKVPRHMRRNKPNYLLQKMLKKYRKWDGFWISDKKLDKIVADYKIRDKHIGIRELSSFEESHSIRHVTDGEKDHKKRNSFCPMFPYLAPAPRLILC